MAFVLTVALLIVAAAAAALGYRLSQRAFRRYLSELDAKTSGQLAALYQTVKSLEAEVTQLRKRAEPAATAPALSSQPASLPAGPTQEITADTLVLLAAAVTAFLGKKVRIRSARMLQSPYEIVNPWAQQGRAIVQASHNLPKS